MSRLSHALKARFGTARNVMKKLGLDDALLDFDERQSEGERAEESLHDKPLTSLRSAVDRLVGKHSARDDDPMVQELYDIADRHDRAKDSRRRGRDSIPPKIESMPEQNLSSGHGRADDDEPDDEYEKFRQHLQDHGLDEAAIEHAIAMAKDMHRRSMNGHDRFPRNRVAGGRGGHFGGGRDRDELPEERTQRESTMNAIIDHGLDSRRSWGAHDGFSEIAKIRDLVKRIDCEPGYAPERYRGAMDKRPGLSERQVEKLHRLIPGIALIGTVSEEGVARRDGSHKNPYEVI